MNSNFNYSTILRYNVESIEIVQCKCQPSSDEVLTTEIAPVYYFIYNSYIYLFKFFVNYSLYLRI